MANNKRNFYEGDLPGTEDEDLAAADLPRLERGLLADGVGPRVRLLRNLLSYRVTAALEPYGLRSGALTTLTLISANEGCSQADLSREMGMNKSAVVAIVDELESRGLAVRDRSSQDRRRNLLSLTEEGERIMRAMHQTAAAQESGLRAVFTDTEFRQFLDYLDRAYDTLSG